jgi:hypothetical protein
VKPVLKQYGIKSIPTAILFDPNGNVLETFRASGDAVKDFITAHQADMKTLAKVEQTPSHQGDPAGMPPLTSSNEQERTRDNPNPSSTSVADTRQPSSSGGSLCVTLEIPCGLPGVAAASAGPESSLAAQKAAFLKSAGGAYGYNGWLDAHYHSEVGKRLGPDRHYMDYTGKKLHILQAVMQSLQPHKKE